MEPSKPEVVSPPFSSHADYYLLGWRARSKSPLKNATIHIVAVGLLLKSISVPIVKFIRCVTGLLTFQLNQGASGKKSETRLVSLDDPMVARGNTNSNEVQEFWHHLPNLTYNTEHHLHIGVCNEHACKEYESDTPSVKFKTMKFSSELALYLYSFQRTVSIDFCGCFFRFK